MPRRKFAKADYELIHMDLTNEQLGAAVRLLYHMTERWIIGAAPLHFPAPVDQVLL